MEYKLELEPIEEIHHPSEADENHYFQAATVGYRNGEYYLRHFKHFDEHGPAITWNWPAFLFTFFWFLYRKMWGWALLYLVLPIPIAVLWKVVTPGSENALYITAGIYTGVIYLVFPMMANILYYRHVNRKIARVQRAVSTRETRMKMLTGLGGTSALVAIPFALALIGAIAAGLVNYSIPAYYEYKSRVMVEAVLMSAVEYQREVERYAERYKRWPRSEGDIDGMPTTRGSFLQRVTLKHGTLYFRFSDEQPLSGKSLMLIPEVSEGGYVMWTCRGLDILNTYLPPGCRS